MRVCTCACVIWPCASVCSRRKCQAAHTTINRNKSKQKKRLSVPWRSLWVCWQLLAGVIRWCRSDEQDYPAPAGLHSVRYPSLLIRSVKPARATEASAAKQLPAHHAVNVVFRHDRDTHLHLQLLPTRFGHNFPLGYEAEIKREKVPGFMHKCSSREALDGSPVPSLRAHSSAKLLLLVPSNYLPARTTTPSAPSCKASARIEAVCFLFLLPSSSVWMGCNDIGGKKRKRNTTRSLLPPLMPGTVRAALGGVSTY